MYGRLWRALPGRWPIRVLILLLGFTVLAWACFEWVYPALAPYLPLSGTTPAGQQGVG